MREVDGEREEWRIGGEVRREGEGGRNDRIRYMEDWLWFLRIAFLFVN